MASVNKVTLIGNLGRDPEVRYAPSGAAVCNITIATSRSWKDKTSGERQEETEWHRVVFYDRLAEIAGAEEGDVVVAGGSQDLTGQRKLPALDFLRSNLLDNTGKWRDSDVMDGSDDTEPAATLKRLLSRAHRESRDVYIFGRFYAQGDGLHDVHLNQGSSKGFIHRPGDDSNDHNDIWQASGQRGRSLTACRSASTASSSRCSERSRPATAT